MGAGGREREREREQYMFEGIDIEFLPSQLTCIPEAVVPLYCV
jgi:hypothetical protein